MPFVTRFNDIVNGAITFTGNTLGLTGNSNTINGVAGTFDSITAFTTIDTSLQFGSFPAGTTDQFSLNSSSAILRLPPGASVLYAELLWSSYFLFSATTGVINVTASINDAVSFTTPAGSFTISHDPATAFQFAETATTAAYIRSANVTDLVRAGGAGTYTTGQVPSAFRAVGWTLAVVYQDVSLPFRSIELFVGIEGVTPTNHPTFEISGFSTPLEGTIEGRLLVAALEGDASGTTDRFFFGPNLSSLTLLRGPNNFVNNFFASQINGDDGYLDTSGTFGDRNAINGNPGTATLACRHGWDITNIDISSTLSLGQTSAVVQAFTLDDRYNLNALAVQIDINSPLLTVVKDVDRTVIFAGEVIAYAINVTNTGLVTANSAVLTDALPEGSEFVAGSVTIDDVVFSDLDPRTGIPLGDVAADESIVIRFQARQVSIPPNNEAINLAIVQFTFVQAAGLEPLAGEAASDEVSVLIAEIAGTAVKSANKSVTFVDDVITYTVTVTNTGNLDASFDFDGDALPPEVTFIAGSVSVGGELNPDLSPVDGFPLGTLIPGETVDIEYSVLVTAVPADLILTNQAQFTLTGMTPTGTTFTNTILANTVTIGVVVLENDLTTVKSADTSLAANGDIITFTVTVANNGPFNVNNVTVQDPLADELAFVPGSLTINGTMQPELTPLDSIAIGQLLVGQSAVIMYLAQVRLTAETLRIVNRASTSYTFLAPDGSTVSGDSVSNDAVIPVYAEPPIIVVNKIADRSIATVGDIITFTFPIANEGTIPIESGTLTDPISSFLSFIEGSVTINGIAIPGGNPAAGIIFGPLEPGAAITIAFQVQIIAVPPDLRITNNASIQVTFPNIPGGAAIIDVPTDQISILEDVATLSMVKSASVQTATVGDIVTFTIIVTNTGNLDARNIVLFDQLPTFAEFEPGSLFINNIVQRHLNLAGGVSIESLLPRESAVIQLKVLIIAHPAGERFNNQAFASFVFKASDGIVRSSQAKSNVLHIPVSPFQDPQISVIQSASANTAEENEIIILNLIIRNEGAVFVGNVTLFDTLDPNLAFIPGTFTINGQHVADIPSLSDGSLTIPAILGQNEGINLGSLNPGQSLQITVQVRVTPQEGISEIANQAEVTFTFRNQLGVGQQGTARSNIVMIEIIGDEE
ncbi:DUF11 domain-containing protein [Paenibacillus harenae]|uniref:Repeat protein (TIGR01451 family) n=1 Tax=Paenibacillus harenae TaxID=306543 RepID=A0ABT9U3I8_PAEHA|nr:DUF11 domain-containing protein [Paenibacillus harenae]MDQ0114212.1 putative repeat protein (TIGR01451 family) [Paenibacillus harenae]